MYIVFVEPNRMRTLTTLFLLGAFFTMHAQNPSVTLEVEEVAISAEALDVIAAELGSDARCYRVYAAFPENYELQFIYGLLSTPIDITASGGFYQAAVGGPTALSINPGLFVSNPEAEFDSWLTIGDDDQVDNQIFILPDEFIFTSWETGSNQLLIDGPLGGGVYITTEFAIPQNTPDANGRVLIGQFTFAGALDGQLSLQLRRLNPDGSIYDPPGAANNETFIAENLTFSVAAGGGCSADLDNSGLVNFEDLLLLLPNIGCLSNCSGDVTGDGIVTIADLLLLLSEFGDSCAN